MVENIFLVLMGLSRGLLFGNGLHGVYLDREHFFAQKAHEEVHFFREAADQELLLRWCGEKHNIERETKKRGGGGGVSFNTGGIYIRNVSAFG